MKRILFTPTKLTFLMLVLAGFFVLRSNIAEGRMTGGGSFFQGDLRVTHGFELHCNITRSQNNLEVNWGQGNHFHLDALAGASCSWTGDPTPPDAPFNTYFGHGFGTYNGQPGYQCDWMFIDNGEPGVDDVADITIRAPDGTIVLNAGPAKLTYGNHQAHRETGNS